MRKILLILSLNWIIGTCLNTFARANEEILTSEEVVTSLHVNPYPKFRARIFSEFMAPSFGGVHSYVPRPSGDAFVPSFFNALFVIDHEISDRLRLVYFQKGMLLMEGGTGSIGLTGRFLDSRFALKRTQLTGSSEWMSEIDLFIQPGFLAGLTPQKNRLFDTGTRLTLNYRPLGSRLSLGFVGDFSYTFYAADGAGADLSVVLYPSVGVQLSQNFSTQHWFFTPIKHVKDAPWNQFMWDITGMPYVQNGIKYSISKNLWAAVFLNNYLLVAPSLGNTWSSLWVNYAFN